MTADDFSRELDELLARAQRDGVDMATILSVLTGTLTVEAVRANLGSRLLSLIPHAFEIAARTLSPPPG